MDAVISDSVCEGEMKREMIGMLQLLPIPDVHFE